MQVVQVNFRTSPEVREELKRHANARGLTLGEFIEGQVAQLGTAADVAREAARQKLVERAAFGLLLQLAEEKKPGVFWGRVARACAMGSTSAADLCTTLGFHCETGERIKEGAHQ